MASATREPGQEAPASPAALAEPAALSASRQLARQVLVVRVAWMLVVVLIALGTAGFLLYERQRAIEAADRESRQFADELGESLDATLAFAGTAVAALDLRLAHASPGDDASVPLNPVTRQLARLLAAQRVPIEVRLLDAAGRQWGLDGRLAATQLDHPPADLPAGRWVAEPPGSREPGRPMPLWRSAAPNSHGVVAYLVQIDPARLLSTLRVRPTPSAGMLLVRVENDGATRVLVRAPHDPAVVDVRVRGSLAQALTRAGTGSYRSVTPVDGVVRVIGYRRLEGQAADLVVAYGLTLDEVLVHWHDLVPLMTGAMALLAALAVVAGRRLERSLRALSRSQEAVEHREAQLQALADELELRVRARTAELAHSEQRLRHANQELQTFTYSVSHDLKAPLRGIDGYSRLLLQDHAATLNDEGRVFLGHIRQATQHMGALIDDLLAYSRLERREPTLVALPLAALVRSVTELFQAETGSGGPSLQLEVPETLQVRADHQGLTMALRNLVDNAIKFSRGRDDARVLIRGRREGATVLIEVADNGSGFDMKFHDRIFAIFQRLHRAEDYPGTGVGLAIVRKAMERMGGRVWAHSEPGRGATFTLEIPEADS